MTFLVALCIILMLEVVYLTVAENFATGVFGVFGFLAMVFGSWVVGSETLSGYEYSLPPEVTVILVGFVLFMTQHCARVLIRSRNIKNGSPG